MKVRSKLLVTFEFSIKKLWSLLMHLPLRAFKKMKIPYKKRQTKIHLIFGVAWLTFFLIGFTFSTKLHWTSYGYLLISLAYLTIYFYQKRYNYVSMEKGFLTVNGPFGKRTGLQEIKRIKKFAGDYIVKTNNKELTIHSQMLEPDSLIELDTKFEKLNIHGNDQSV